MTPAQLRAYAAVVRLGSVKEAAAELRVSDAAVSGHVAGLRRELEDRLFSRCASGLAFTPGGLRLAARATEMLGLQAQTIREVSEAGHGRRMLRLAVSSLFAEYAAPGLIELFTARAADLDVELSVHPGDDLAALIVSRVADVAIGPRSANRQGSVSQTAFLRYEVLVVAAAGHHLTGAGVRAAQLRDQPWLLGPSATEPSSDAARLLRHFEVPESRQRIFQSHAAALEEARRGGGLAPAVSSAVADDLAGGRLVRLAARGGCAEGLWTAITLPSHSLLPAAAELTRFITTPRAMQAMLHGSGAKIGHFRPSVHVTLWS